MSLLDELNRTLSQLRREYFDVFGTARDEAPAQDSGCEIPNGSIVDAVLSDDEDTADPDFCGGKGGRKSGKIDMLIHLRRFKPWL